eukprot:6002710-Prymnesium_polylepis.1
MHTRAGDVKRHDCSGMRVTRRAWALPDQEHTQVRQIAHCVLPHPTLCAALAAWLWRLGGEHFLETVIYLGGTGVGRNRKVPPRNLGEHSAPAHLRMALRRP